MIIHGHFQVQQLSDLLDAVARQRGLARLPNDPVLILEYLTPWWMNQSVMSRPSYRSPPNLESRSHRFCLTLSSLRDFPLSPSKPVVIWPRLADLNKVGAQCWSAP